MAKLLLPIIWMTVLGMLISGSASAAFARSYGRSPYLWFFLGMVFPIGSLGVLGLLGRKSSL